MIWFALGLVALVVILGLWNWAAFAKIGQLKRLVSTLAVVGLLGLGVLLVATGRFAVSWPFLIGAALAYQRARGAHAFFKTLGQIFGRKTPSQGNVSEVETSHLKMKLDHDSGTIQGEVIAGRFRGRQLAELSLAELTEKLAELRREDSDGARLLETYLDRTQGPEWRQQGEEEPQGGERKRRSGAMDAEEARSILGVGVDADEAEIKAAHRRLMQKLHPDQGGSTYLASKLNQAKDVLLWRRRSR